MGRRAEISLIYPGAMGTGGLQRVGRALRRDMKKEMEKYVFKPREFLMYLCMYLAADALVSYLFYRSVLAFILFLPGLVIFFRRKKAELALKRQKEAAVEFRDAILSVSALLGAGYSVENAFVEAGNDLKNLYGERSLMVREFNSIPRKLAANETMESILSQMAERVSCPDIRDFVDVFITAKRTGGDMVSIIRRSAAHIGEKIEVKRDIETVMSAKKMEQRVMNAVPFCIIFYVSVNSPGFLDALYHNLTGVVVMSLCLLAYLGALALAEKIVSIEV